jgi:predicted house-cleaning noncanonical NTP pyrophosphatase (MazG superfamily)
MTKLIRDLIPHIAASRGQQLDIRIAGPAELPALLRNKIVEEAAEVAAAGPDELLDELADVLEVVHALTLAAGHSLADLDQARVAKAVERGGFTRGLVLQQEATS